MFPSVTLTVVGSQVPRWVHFDNSCLSKLGRFFPPGKRRIKKNQKKFMQPLQIFNSRNRDALDVIVPPPSCFFAFFVGGLGVCVEEGVNNACPWF
jgi:hypothetical protein